jgi:hypothetical protein
MIGGFMIGVLAGAVAMWKYGPRVRGFVDDKTRTARSRAASGLKSVADTVETGMGTLPRAAGESAHRADGA